MLWSCANGDQSAQCVGIAAGIRESWSIRLFQAWSVYMTWAVCYASVIFVFARKRIERKRRDTLYGYFAHTLGMKDKLPGWLRQYSGVVFHDGSPDPLHLRSRFHCFAIYHPSHRHSSGSHGLFPQWRPVLRGSLLESARAQHRPLPGCCQYHDDQKHPRKAVIAAWTRRARGQTTLRPAMISKPWKWPHAWWKMYRQSANPWPCCCEILWVNNSHRFHDSMAWYLTKRVGFLLFHWTE